MVVGVVVVVVVAVVVVVLKVVGDHCDALKACVGHAKLLQNDHSLHASSKDLYVVTSL